MAIVKSLDELNKSVIGGEGYSWVNETSNRVVGTNYTNTKQKATFVSVSIRELRNGDWESFWLTVNGIIVAKGSSYYQEAGYSDSNQICAIIPINGTYRVDSHEPMNTAIEHWAELK